MDRSSTELAGIWFDAWKALDIERLRSVLAPGFVHTSPLGRLEGRDHYLTVVEPMARESVVELAVHEIVAEGDVAAVRFTNTTPRGSVESCDRIRAKDGLIEEIRSFYDSVLVRESLGDSSTY
jgi:ketosteroid isomerase-like protein